MNKMNWLQSNYICTHTYISYGGFTGGARIIAREQIKDIRILSCRRNGTSCFCSAVCTCKAAGAVSPATKLKSAPNK